MITSFGGPELYACATVKPGDLVETVQAALNDPPEQQQAREAALDIVYPIRTGGAQIAADALTAWMESREAVAA